MQQVDQLNALLNSDLSDTPTTRPLLNGLAILKLAEAKIEPNKANDGSNLNMKFVTTEVMIATDGRTVSAGFPIYHTVSLKQTEKYSPKENLARVREAITGDHKGAFAPVEQYIDGTCAAQLRPKLDEEFGDKTIISKFVKKG